MPDWHRWVITGVKVAAWASRLLVRADGEPRGKLPHSRPREECPFPLSGHPYYLAGITIGGPVSDHGSHSGIKAAVRPSGDGTGRDLLETAHYSAFATVASLIDRSRVRLDGAPLERTEIEMRPWGWLERARGQGGLRAEAEAATLALNVFILVVRLANDGAQALAPRPSLEVIDDPDPADEAQQPLRLSRGGRWRAALEPCGTAAIRYTRRTGPGPLAFDDTRFSRRIACSSGPLRLRRIRPRFRVSLEAPPLSLAPGGTASLHFLVACGETDAEAAASLARGQERLRTAGSLQPGASAARSAEGALAAIRDDWGRHLGALPTPRDGLSPTDRRTLEIAATGLRMSEFAARGRMPVRGTICSKVHFNLFACWDLAFQALGLKEWDPALAKDTLTLLLAGQMPDGSICYATGPDMQPFNPLLVGVSQPPVVALAVRETFEQDGLRDRPWLAATYARLEPYVRWWETERDRNGDGLFSFRCAFESGWDDTPRIPNPRVPPIHALGLDLANLSGLAPAAHVAPVDLNGWMYLVYDSMAGIARHLERPEEAGAWDAKARALADRIDAVLWDESSEAYLDRDVAPDGTPGRFHRVITPAIAWPLFAGAVRDRRRAARLIERHLLDPAQLMGDPSDPARPRFPVPSVSYSDPTYNHEGDGYYWRGQIWLIPSYAVLTALHRYGYAREADVLRARLLGLVAHACEGGIFESYDALTGAVGFGSGSLSGAGEPACFQIGLSTAVVAMIALRSYERYPVVEREAPVPVPAPAPGAHP